MGLLPVFAGTVHESCTPLPLAGSAARFVGEPATLAPTTLTEAAPWIAPTEANTEPLPVPAAKVVLAPVDGETVPRATG